MAKNKDRITVYPAHAGVILFGGFALVSFGSLSRTRGGDPNRTTPNHSKN